MSTPPVAAPQRTARWVVTLFALAVVLQRFALPGTEVALLLLVLVAWISLALVHGIVAPDPVRLLVFAWVVAATGAAVGLQSLLVPAPLISPGSWALVLTTSFPLTMRLVDRRSRTFHLTLQYVVRCGLVLASLCLVMTASQAVGLSYKDILGDTLPDSVLIDGFAISYPYSFGSDLYRANAWIGLEPSIISIQLGVAVLAAVLLRRSPVTLLVLVLGIASTASGSGILLVVAGLLALLVGGGPRRTGLRRYALPATIAAVVALLTPFGLALFARVSEIAQTGSSASLRSVQPYQLLGPPWTKSLPTAVWGRGPGSSEELIRASGIDGLLVPTPLKIFFEYGLLAGTVLAGFLLLCYARSGSRTLAVALFVCLWSFQSGLTTTVLVTILVSMVSLWAPRPGPALEDVARPELDLHGLPDVGGKREEAVRS